MTLCKKDIVYFTNNFISTFDPRVEPSVLPMILFPIQEEFLREVDDCVMTKRDMICEKSRDMGVTWLCCIYMLHKWLFNDGFAGCIGSRKEELVDKADDPKCIFEKLRMALYSLPAWMMPKGFNRNKHDKHMNLINPQRGSTITGEAGDQMGRGGRATVYFVDEAAFIERAEKVNAALSQNTNCRIYVSTPNGIGNSFAQKRKAALKNPNGKTKLFTMHWKKDPRKNVLTPVVDPETGETKMVYKWYEDQKEIINDPVIIAQELDIDYSASIEGVCIPADWVDAAVDFDQWLKDTKGLVLPSGIKGTGYDVAEKGKNLNVLVHRDGPRVYEVQAWNKVDSHVSAGKVIRACNARFIDRLNFDADGVGSTMGTNLKSTFFGKRTFYTYGVRGGGKCSNKKWPNGFDHLGQVRYKLSKDKFENPRAENWWELRERFERTYQYKVEGVPHPLESLISIPNIPILIEQLSSVLYETKDNGKIKIEGKKEMKVRNVPSPDYADACVMAFVERKIEESEIIESGYNQDLS